MPPTVPRSVKTQVIALLHEQGFTVKKVCGILNIRKTAVYKVLAYFRAYGVPYNPHSHKSGRKRTLAQGDIKYIIGLLNCRHSLYLDEIQKQLCNERGATVSISTLIHTLCRLHYSHKVASVRALERNDLLRSAFMNKIANIVRNPYMLMFVDEATLNKRTSARTKGWSLVGKRCVQRRCFGHG
jgi:transposase